MDRGSPGIGNISPGATVGEDIINDKASAPQLPGGQQSTSSLPTSAESLLTPVASAIDFLKDGPTIVHSTFTHPSSPDSSLCFKCAPQLNSVRVVLHHTEDVHVGSDDDELLTNCFCVQFPNQDSPICNVCHFREMDHSTYHASSHTSSTSELRSPFSERTDRYHGVLHGGDGSIPFDGRSRSSCSTCEGRRWAKGWKTYGSAAGLDQRDLHEFWYHGGFLDLGTNVLLDDVSTVEARTWNSAAGSDSYVLYLGGAMYPVYILPSCVRLQRRQDRYIQIECRFFRIESKYGPYEHSISASLREAFWARLNARTSMPCLFNGDLDMGALLLTLELLAAQEDVFWRFLRHVRVNTPRTLLNFEADSGNAFLSDKQHFLGYRRAVRDLVQASKFTVDTIRCHPASSQNLEAALEGAVARQKAIETDLKFFVADIEEDVERMIHMSEKDITQGRDATLRRLTLVASIFLPLTFACSILSMSTRVKELGSLWWDWLGICAITAVILLTGYHLSRGWDNLENAMRTEAFKRWPPRLYWNKAKRDTLHIRSPEVRRRKVLLPPVVGRSWLISKIGFCLAICASFLLGMFHSNLRQAAYILVCSIPGTFIFFFAFIAFSKLVQQATMRLLHHRQGSAASDASSASQDTELEMLAQNVRRTQWLMYPIYFIVGCIQQFESNRMSGTSANEATAWYWCQLGSLRVGLPSFSSSFSAIYTSPLLFASLKSSTWTHCVNVDSISIDLIELTGGPFLKSKELLTTAGCAMHFVHF